MNERVPEPKHDEVLTRLLRSSGRGPTASTEARSRIYTAVRERWQESLPGRVSSARRGDRRRGFALTWKFALAAGLAAIAVLAYRVQAPRTDSMPPFASVAKVQGDVAIRRGGEVRDVRIEAPATVSVGDLLTTGAGARVALQLENGYVLRVNSGSELLLAAADGVELRSGTVYFDSNFAALDEPLTIATPLGSVRHAGTQFETSLVDAGLRIRVREGAVILSDGAGDLLARAGEQMHVASGSAPQRTAIGADDAAWQWVEDLAMVQPAAEYPLPEVLAWVSRETGRALRYADAPTEARAQSVVLYELEGLTPRETLDVIRSTTELDYRYVEGGLLVTSADL
jgi:ferric-dicitrate binding protein FerR (iron transport regulator)